MGKQAAAAKSLSGIQVATAPAVPAARYRPPPPPPLSAKATAGCRCPRRLLPKASPTAAAPLVVMAKTPAPKAPPIATPPPAVAKVAPPSQPRPSRPRRQPSWCCSPRRSLRVRRPQAGSTPAAAPLRPPHSGRPTSSPGTSPAPPPAVPRPAAAPATAAGPRQRQRYRQRSKPSCGANITRPSRWRCRSLVVAVPTPSRPGASWAERVQLWAGPAGNECLQPPARSRSSTNADRTLPTQRPELQRQPVRTGRVGQAGPRISLAAGAQPYNPAHVTTAAHAATACARVCNPLSLCTHGGHLRAGLDPPPAERHDGQRWQRFFGDCVFALFRDLGATFIKVGQIMSTRPDLLPHTLFRPCSAYRTTSAPSRSLMSARRSKPTWASL